MTLARRLPPLLVAAVTFACFLPAVRHGFVNWDDDVNFLANPSYRGLGPPQLRWMFTDTHGHYMPLTWLTLGLDYALWGLDPTGYHLTSILLHVAVAVLFYFVLRGLGPSPWAAAAGTLVYSIHPLRVESVAWVTERRDVVCGLFVMLTLLAYLKGTRAADRRRWMSISLACFAAALLSKTTAMTLPLALIVLDIHPLRRRAWVEKLPFLALAVGGAVLAIVTQSRADAFASAGQYGWIDRLEQPAVRLCFYASKTLLPLGLSPLYLFRPASTAAAVGSAAVAIGVTAALIALRRRAPAALAAWAAFGLLISPVLGLVQAGLHSTADRYTYLPGLAVGAFVAAALPPRRWAALPCLAVLAALAFQTVRQVGVWRDSDRLWSHAIAVDPDHFVAHLKRGIARVDAGRHAEAMADYARAIELRPSFAPPYAGIGILHLKDGYLDDAIRCLDEAVRLDPTDAEALNARGVAKLRLGDAAGAFADFSEAIRLRPGYALAWRNRAESREDPAAAAGDLQEAARLNPFDAEAFALLGRAQMSAGRTQEALRAFDSAIALDPRDFQSLLYRGILRGRLGDTDGSIADFESASAVYPGPASRYYIRAIGRLMNGDREGAIEDLRIAVDSSAPGTPVGDAARLELERLAAP